MLKGSTRQVLIQYMWLFKLIKAKCNEKLSSLVPLATFEGLISYMWLVANLLDSIDTEHHRNFD